MQGGRVLSLVAIVAVTYFGFGLADVCPNLQNNVCYFTNVAKLQPSAQTQYYAVGGLFNVHKRGETAYNCGSQFNPSGVMLSQAFLWSLQYWQSRTAPSASLVSVGGVVFDSCGREEQMIQNLLGFEQCNLRIEGIDRHNLVGFVGTSNTDVMAAASLTADMDLTLISPMADSVLLSNHKKYPYFLRTVPSLQVDVEIMRQVLGHVQTQHVAVIYEESQMAAFQAFNMTMKDGKICVTAAFLMKADDDDDKIRAFYADNLSALEKIRFIALFTSPELAVKLMTQAAAGSARNKNLVYLVPSDIPQSSVLFNGSYTVPLKDAIVLQRVPVGVDDAVSDFKQYWSQLIQGNAPANSRVANPYLTEYLNKTSASQIPRDHWALANTIMATKSFVDGVFQAGSGICANDRTYLCSTFFDVKSRGSNINQKIRQSTNYFTLDVPNVGFLDGDLRASVVKYSVYLYKVDGTLLPVGSFANGSLTFSTPISSLGPYRPGACPSSPCRECGELPTTTTSTTPATTPLSDRCQPESAGGNFSVVFYPPDQEITGAYMAAHRTDAEFATRFEVRQRWVIALGALAGLGILAVLIFEIYILYKLLGTRMGHKWRTMWLGQLLLFGILLCYLTLFAYLPIPTDATCGITRFGVGVSYSICFAVLLVKLMVILTSKTSETSLLPGDAESPNYLKGVYQFLMFVFVVGVQVVIDAQWLITVPPEAIKVTGNHGGQVWVCNHYTFRASGSMSSMTDMAAFVRSEFENHVLSLVYIMFLILITTILALNAHGIITNHRESVFIGIAAGFSIPVWLAWTLVGGLNKDHNYAHEFGDACIAFGLFLTATLILFAMFLPKVRQLVSMGVEGIYFEDDRDTVYAGSVIMAPPSYKSRPNSVIYVNNQGIYSEPVVLGNGDSSNYLRHPGASHHPTPASTYSAPPIFSKRGDSSVRGGSVLRVTDDLSGRRPLEKKRPMSEVAYGTASRPRSHRGTLPRSRSHTSLGAL